MRGWLRPVSAGLALAALVAGVPATAQQSGIDSDLVPNQARTAPATPPATTYPSPAYAAPSYAAPSYAPPVPAAPAPYAQPGGYSPGGCVMPHAPGGTYRDDDLIGAAEGIFGKGAQGLADMIEDVLKKQGRPDGYIVGREAGGAFAVGLRYGSGQLCSQIVGAHPVYWAGPSIGFDAGANAAKTFVLVYNLYHESDLYHRIGAGEGQAYLVGGFNISYLRRGDVVLIPVRMGVGLRLGINGGYMKMSPKQNWFPF